MLLLITNESPDEPITHNYHFNYRFSRNGMILILDLNGIYRIFFHKSLFGTTGGENMIFFGTFIH